MKVLYVYTSRDGHPTGVVKFSLANGVQPRLSESGVLTINEHNGELIAAFPAGTWQYAKVEDTSNIGQEG